MTLQGITVESMFGHGSADDLTKTKVEEIDTGETHWVIKQEDRMQNLKIKQEQELNGDQKTQESRTQNLK